MVCLTILQTSDVSEKSSVYSSQSEQGVELVDMATGSLTGPPTFKEKLMNFVGESERNKEVKDREKVEKRLTEVHVYMCIPYLLYI